jgi:hypothetical protein
MANFTGSPLEGLGNLCTPMPAMEDSREATETSGFSSDGTPQEVLTTTFIDGEPPCSEETSSASDTVHELQEHQDFSVNDSDSAEPPMLDAQSSHPGFVQRKVNHYTGKKPSSKRKTGVRRKWTKEEYKIAVECRIRAENDSSIGGIGKKVMQNWNNKNMFEINQNTLMGQIRTILSKGWLTPVEIETIRRKIEKDMAPEPNELPSDVTDIISEHVEEYEPEDEDGVVEAELAEAQLAEAVAPEMVVAVDENAGAEVAEVEVVEADVAEMDVAVEENRAVHDGEIHRLSEEESAILKRLTEIFSKEDKGKIYNLKNCDYSKVKKETARVNNILRHVPVNNITEVRNLLQAGAVLVGELLEIRESRPREHKEPFWKRRVQQDVKRLRKDLGRVESWFKGKWKHTKKGEKEQLDRRYKLKAKGFNVVIEEIKQRVTAKSSKIKRYQKRIKQYQDNKLFTANQGRFFKNLDGGEGKTLAPNPDESTRFWSGIWGESVLHNGNAEWIERVKTKLRGPKQSNIDVTSVDVKKQIKSMPKWKGPGPDGLHGFWIKSFSNVHESLSTSLSDCINTCDVPTWMVEGRTILVMKDVGKGPDVGNYRPIACLNLIWKLLTGIFSEKTYAYLDLNNMLPVEQKGCKKGCLGTKDQLAIDKCVIKNSITRKTNLCMSWIDYKKAYDMVPHSWIIETLKMVGVADNIIDFISRSMCQWKTNLYSDNQFLGEVNIRRGIFQGDSFSPLLFVIALIPLTHVLRETNMGYQLEKNGPKINHLLFMDDLKMFAKNENEIDSLVQTVQQCSDDIRMEFGISKCATVSLKRGKRTHMDGIKLPTGDEIGDPDAGGYKYLGVLELDIMLVRKMKSKVKETYLKRLRLLLKSHLNGRNLFSAINSWAVAVIRYSAAFIGWTQAEMMQLDRDTRKLLVKFGALHPKSNVVRVYMKRKNGGRGLIGVEDCVGGELRSVHHYLSNSHEELLKLVAKEEGLDNNSLEEKAQYKKRIEEEKMKGLTNMKLHGQHERDTKHLKSEKTWNFLSKGDLKRETESLILAAQEQALNTNAVKKNIYGMECTDRCRLCGTELETVNHIVSACQTLAQREYKRRHDKVCANLHWNLCRKFGIEVTEKWYQHQPEAVVENEQVKILWDFMIQCDRDIEHRKPDIVVVNKEANTCQLIDVACPSDLNLVGKRNEKLRNYQLLRVEVARLWDKKTSIIPVIIGALGSIPKDIDTYLTQLGIDYNLNILQHSVLLGTANILRQVLSI